VGYFKSSDCVNVSLYAKDTVDICLQTIRTGTDERESLLGVLTHRGILAKISRGVFARAKTRKRE
jgi:hypothetical protein